MKNLMNRVLVVLAVSAVFAGSINAATPKGKGKPAAKTAVMSGKEAFDKLQYKGGLNFKKYPAADRKTDAATLRTEVSGAKDAITALEKEALIQDDAKRQASFDAGAARKAIAAIELAMRNKALKDATEEAKANPSEENTANLAMEKMTTEAAVSELDKVAGGNKGYMTQRNVALAAVGLAGVTVAGLLITYGAPAFLAPYVPQAMTDMSTSIRKNVGAAAEYVSGKASALGTAMGLGAEGRIGKAARRMGTGAAYYGKEIATATGLAALRAKASEMYYGKQLEEEGKKLEQQGQALQQQ